MHTRAAAIGDSRQTYTTIPSNMQQFLAGRFLCAIVRLNVYEYDCG